MLQIDRWKRILIVGLCVLGIGFAVPNLFYQRVESHNDALAEIERELDAQHGHFRPGMGKSGCMAL